MSGCIALYNTNLDKNSQCLVPARQIIHASIQYGYELMQILATKSIDIPQILASFPKATAQVPTALISY